MDPEPPRQLHSREQLSRKRQKFRERISTALDEEDDPLALYDQFVQWTLGNYGENDPHSGLIELLEETTRTFKDDTAYRGDLRYLKLWSLYARHVDKPATVYAFLMANDIGTKYSVLYEEYANILEQDGLRPEAEAIYRAGIKRNIRAVERLKNRFRDFQSRTASSSSLPAPEAASSAKPTGVNSLDALRRNPLKNHNPSTLSPNSAPSLNPSISRYALMLAPPAPGKRPEKLRFNLSLLFTEEGVEYSIQEARARSMDLLGKTWGPPPGAKISASSGSVPFKEPPNRSAAMKLGAHLSMPPESYTEDMTVTIDTKDAMMGARRRSFMMGEPTVTINTKEALADVFGMYNSPEKTSRLARIPGSKHAPLRKVESITPVARQPSQAQANNENADHNAKTPTPAFRPFVDENFGRKEKVTPAPSKFKPFVDSDPSNRACVTPDVGRRALSDKDSSTPAPKCNEIAVRNVLKTVLEENNGSVFSKVFTPASTKLPVRKAFVEEQSQTPIPPRTIISLTPGPEPVNVFRATAPTAFTPFVDPNATTPFRVFSRPPAQSEDVFSKRETFPPFSDFKDNGLLPTSPSPLAITSWTPTLDVDVIEIEDDEEVGAEQVPEPYSDSDSPAANDGPYEDGECYQEVPLGGRFGRFNVMTPITERTFEFTTSTRGSGTPIDHPSPFHRDKPFVQHDEHGAVEAAERLAAELREEEAVSLAQESFDESDSSFASFDEQPLKQPFHLPHDSPSKQSEDHFTDAMEEKTGTLSLLDALTISSHFKPPNPCNPFDPPIVSTLLSLILSDTEYHDLRDTEANLLEGLRKFAKRTRKTSGNATNTTGVFDVSASFPFTLAGHQFDVSEKLGEGGFGAVFKARDLGMKRKDDEDDDDEDEDGDGSAMVALKVVKPRNVWEYHVLRRLHSKLPSHLRQSVVLPHALYAFRDESFLVLDLCPQGTLLDIVNHAGTAGVAQQGACLDELLVMFFAIELLRLLEGMHNVGFIHGDLKIDNCLLRLEDVPGGGSAWSSLYQPSGEGGWRCKGIKLIDFGRTIDTLLFPASQTFVAEWPTDDRDCLEMRRDRPWTYQTDYFGLAGIIYCMLFGKYIQSASVTAVSPGVERYKIATPLKRYWQTDLWNRLFDILLNPSLIRDGQLPLCQELGALREEMEGWLQSNCNRTSITLKGLLKKVEVSVWRS